MAIRSRFVRAAISPPDTTAPSIPQNLRQVDTSQTSFSIVWDTSTDNRSVLGYEVAIDNVVEPGLQQTNGYTKTGLTAATTYATKVRAVDNSLNRSSYSSVTNITTASSGGGGGGGDSLVPAPSTATPDVYVSPSGTLNGHAAYLTIQAGIDAASVGQMIAVGPGTYQEKVHINKAVHVRAWDDSNRPTLDGNFTYGQWTGSVGSAGLVSINASNVTWDGINLRRPAFLGMQIGYCKGNGFFTPSGDPDVNYVGGTAVWYENIKVYRTTIQEFNNIAVTLLYVRNFYAGQLTCKWGGILRNPYIGDFLEKNEYSWPAAISVGGDGLTFVECDVHQTLTEGWHFGLWTYNIGGYSPGSITNAWLHSKNVTMTKCKAWDCWSASFYIGDIDTGTFDRCLVYKTTDTIYWNYASVPSSRYPSALVSFASESGRSSNYRSYNGQVGSNDVTFKNCVFTGAGNLVECRDGSSGNLAHEYVRIKFLNNTFFSVNQAGLWSNTRGCVTFFYTMRDVTFKNNLLYDSEGMMFGAYNTPPVGTSDIGYNLWSHTRPTGWTGTGDIVNASVGLNNGTYLINNNYPNEPTFDTASFTLVGGSPAINAGTTAAEVTTDYFGTTRPSGIRDIGAYTFRT